MASIGNQSTPGYSINVKLIELMKKHPIPRGLRRKDVYDATWELMEREMNMPRNTVIKKWCNLKVAYRRELRLELKNGTGFVSKWPYFQEMDFLRDELLRKMKADQARVKAKACCSAKDPVEQYPVEATGEGSNYQSEQAHLETAFMDNMLLPPVPGPTTSKVPECGITGPVFHFLMTRIYPYVAAMSTEYQTSVLEKMQQLVFTMFSEERSQRNASN